MGPIKVDVNPPTCLSLGLQCSEFSELAKASADKDSFFD